MCSIGSPKSVRLHGSLLDPLWSSHYNIIIYMCCYKINQGMEDLLSKGLTRAIGISNFTITKTEALLKTAKVIPAVNQVECHPYFQQKKLRRYCDSKGILHSLLQLLTGASTFLVHIMQAYLFKHMDHWVVQLGEGYNQLTL